jgi:hypothetical protein
MVAVRANSYSFLVMTLNEGLKAAYQIPCCFSAALLIMSSIRVAYREFRDWFNRAGLES